ncbi:MAG: phosphotransferase [Nitrospiria bacterium]
MDNLLASTGPNLPQLQMALNPKTMLKCFQETLEPFKRNAFETTDCEIERFRFRQGFRSIIRYHVSIRDVAAGLRRKIWITGMTYPNYKAKRLYRRLSADAPWQGIPSAYLPYKPLAFIPNLNMFIQIFPFDRHLPLLPLLLSGPPALTSLLLKQFGPGNWEMVRCSVDPVRYRPLLGITFRYTIEAIANKTGEPKSKVFYLKHYRDDSGEQVYKQLKKLYRCLCIKDAGFNTVKPIAYLEDLRTLILDAVPGQSLEQTFLNGGDVRMAVSKTARALAKLHLSKLPTSTHRSAKGTLIRAKKAGRLIQCIHPHLGKKMETILDKLASTLKNMPPCPTHLDLKVDHIFIDGDKIIFIDLDSFALSDPVFDPASLLARMVLLPNLAAVPRSTIIEVSQRFYTEYFSMVPDHWRDKLPANYVCALLKVALYYLQHQERNSEKKIRRLLNICTDLLSAHPAGDPPWIIQSSERMTG